MKNSKPRKFVEGKHCTVSRLVMEKIIGRKLEPDEDIHHKDGDRRNNSPNNLQLITHRRHSLFHATRGGRSAKLHLSEVPIIRKMLKDGVKQSVIASIFGVSQPTISMIKIGKAWWYIK